MKHHVSLHIPVDHPAFAGHFPGLPIVPGVVLLDEAMHAVMRHLDGAPQDWKIASAKFLSPLGPDATVTIEFDIQESGSVQFDIVEGERRIATGSLTPIT
jgi:3-hydroxymyristoyl/3-hydroxydecanoyl-(acyl carrier protein) dehydratase